MLILAKFPIRTCIVLKHKSIHTVADIYCLKGKEEIVVVVINFCKVYALRIAVEDENSVLIELIETYNCLVRISFFLFCTESDYNAEIKNGSKIGVLSGLVISILVILKHKSIHIIADIYCLKGEVEIIVVAEYFCKVYITVIKDNYRIIIERIEAYKRLICISIVIIFLIIALGRTYCKSVAGAVVACTGKNTVGKSKSTCKRIKNRAVLVVKNNLAVNDLVSSIEGGSTHHRMVENELYSTCFRINSYSKKSIAKIISTNVGTCNVNNLILAACGFAIPLSGDRGVTLCGNVNNNLVTCCKSKSNGCAKLKSGSVATVYRICNSYRAHDSAACSKSKVSCGRSYVLISCVCSSDLGGADLKGRGNNGSVGRRSALNLACLVSPLNSPILLLGRSDVELKSSTSLKAYGELVAIFIGVIINIGSTGEVVTALCFPCAKACRHLEGVVTLALSGEGYLVNPAVIVGSSSVYVGLLRLEVLNLNLIEVVGVTNVTKVVGASCVKSELGDVKVILYAVVVLCHFSFGKISDFSLSNDLACCVVNSNLSGNIFAIYFIVSAATPPNLNGSCVRNGKFNSRVNFILRYNGLGIPSDSLFGSKFIFKCLAVSLNLSLVCIVKSKEFILTSGYSVREALFSSLCLVSKLAYAKNVSHRGNVIGISLTTVKALAIVVVVTGRIHSVLLGDNSLTLGALLTLGKTALGTGRSLCRKLFLGVTESSYVLVIAMSALGTSKGLVTILGTICILRCGDGVLMLANGLVCATYALAILIGVFCNVRLLGTAFLRVGTSCCVPVISRVIRPICTKCVLVRLRGIDLVKNAIDHVARSESHYHCSKNNYSHKKLKVSLHNRDPPFEFLFLFLK